MTSNFFLVIKQSTLHVYARLSEEVFTRCDCTMLGISQKRIQLLLSLRLFFLGASFRQHFFIDSSIAAQGRQLVCSRLRSSMLTMRAASRNTFSSFYLKNCFSLVWRTVQTAVSEINSVGSNVPNHKFPLVKVNVVLLLPDLVFDCYQYSSVSRFSLRWAFQVLSVNVEAL